MHVQEISERYGLLIEAYLRGCGAHRAELQKQLTALTEFARVANRIKDLKDADRKGILQTELAKIPFKEKLQLPLNPSIEINGIVVEKCRYMDSKKLPLWLVFKNADPNGKTKSVIFKSGDDLRQDMLTLQSKIVQFPSIYSYK
jgi:phosphatidylinositol-4,5-bisphosphate 3-kinase